MAIILVTVGFKMLNGVFFNVLNTKNNEINCMVANRSPNQKI